jgi:mono/diheme cytochrome c family protein
MVQGRSAVLAAMLLSALLAGCDDKPAPGSVQDEAMRAGRDAKSMPAAADDYFKGMDQQQVPGADGPHVAAPQLTEAQIRGRNTWIVWTGGNDRLWDSLVITSGGAFDLLKTISDQPSLKANRDNRWNFLGLVNEPCFEKATAPDPDHFGLWLDKRVEGPGCPADPFADPAKYPGVKVDARGKTVPVGSYYGEPTGVVGLRLFPNPGFDEAARKRWDPVRYYTDPSYYNDKSLVRPYRIGMSCGFCHVGPNPLNPPADPDHPKWENLSSNVGAQYFWIDRIFSWAGDASSYIFQLVHTARPGTLDTSLVSTDYINNPRTMNAIYDLGVRLQTGKAMGRETLVGGELNNKQFNDYTQDPTLAQYFTPPDTVFTPHVLKDGADSVGSLGALNRVFINIGLFSEEWLLHFNALVGGQKTSPIEIAVGRKNSAYWQATENQTVDLASFFLGTTAPHKLAAAPGGSAALSQDAGQLARGKTVFAENCAACHSSKQPKPPAEADLGAHIGPDYLEAWNKYWAWVKTDAFKAQMREIVAADDFLDNNFLSNDARVPNTLLQTNACSPLATNGIADNIWDNYTSHSYKALPSVGTIKIHDPVTGEEKPYEMPAGGRGYTRVPSLISLWSTAPFLLNNSVGPFDSSPSVEARLRVFDASIRQMLWPDTRAKDSVLGAKGVALIDRTTQTSYLSMPLGFLPSFVQNHIALGLRRGRRPAGTDPRGDAGRPAVQHRAAQGRHRFLRQRAPRPQGPEGAVAGRA